MEQMNLLDDNNFGVTFSSCRKYCDSLWR